MQRIGHGASQSVVSRLPASSAASSRFPQHGSSRTEPVVAAEVASSAEVEEAVVVVHVCGSLPRTMTAIHR